MTAAGSPEAWSRDEAIARLRRMLVSVTDGERSTCRLAAERGIFCRGFRRWPVSEFHRRWKNALGRSTHLTRAQMEELADLWQLSEQIRYRLELACDVPGGDGRPCRGWAEFSDAELSRHCREVLGRDVVVAS